MGKKPVRQLHLTIAETLQQRISSGEYVANQQLPPEIELAAIWDVSRGTMRQALHLLVEQGLLTRIPGKGTFVNAPHTFKTQQTDQNQLVGMVFPSLNDALLANITKGVERVLRESHCSLIISYSSNDLEIENEQFEQLRRQRVAGILLFPNSQPGEDLLLEELLKAEMPLILLDREVPGISATTVMADHYEGAYQAVRYLLEAGHKRIVCISHPDHSTSIKERIRGYNQAMRDADLLPFAPVPLTGGGTSLENMPPTYTSSELIWVDRMLDMDERPTALFCINDYIALGVMRHCLERGIQIPSELAIIGFDNNPFCQMAPVPLTTVSQPAEEIGMRAAKILLEQLNNATVEPQIIRLPTTLIVRASS